MTYFTTGGSSCTLKSASEAGGSNWGLRSVCTGEKGGTRDSGKRTDELMFVSACRGKDGGIKTCNTMGCCCSNSSTFPEDQLPPDSSVRASFRAYQGKQTI